MAEKVTDIGPDDASAVSVARAELEKVSARRAVCASTADGGMTNIQAARAIGRVLLQAAEKLGIPEGVGLDEMLNRILDGAHRGGLDPTSYRIAWTLVHAPRQGRRASIVNPR